MSTHAKHRLDNCRPYHKRATARMSEREKERNMGRVDGLCFAAALCRRRIISGGWQDNVAMQQFALFLEDASKSLARHNNDERVIDNSTNAIQLKEWKFLFPD